VAGESGKIDPMHQFQIEPLAPLNIGGYDVSFTNSSLFMMIVLGALWLFMWGGMKRDLVPGRWQMAVEGVTGFVNNMVSSSVGPEGKKYVPLVFSLFMFILMANFMGMMPVGIVPGVHPFTVTSHLTVTAVLAVLGYSVNESVVIFDRIREAFRKFRKMTTPEVIDHAITSTISRTIITHGCTQLMVLSMLIFGGPTLHYFAIALTIGICFGIYSSVFVAAAIAMWLGVHRDDLAKVTSAKEIDPNDPNAGAVV